MKLLNLDWAEMLDALCMWEDLLQSDKEYFLFEMEPGVIASESVPADTADSLVCCGFLAASASGEKLSFTRIGRQFHRIVQALMDLREESNDLLEVPLGDLMAYLKMFYNRKEREETTILRRNDRWEETDLAIQIGSAAWPGRFLRCRSISEWETGTHYTGTDTDPEIVYLDEVFTCAKKILRELISYPVHWIPFAYLPFLLPDSEEDILIEAFEMLLNNMLIQVEFSGVEMTLLVCLHGMIYQFLNPSYGGSDEMDYHAISLDTESPFRIMDMLDLLSEAACKPIPLKKCTGRLYVKKERELAERLIPLPEQLPFREHYIPAWRLEGAMLETRKLLLGDQITERGRQFFTITDRGRKWLKFSLPEQLLAILQGHIPQNHEPRRDCFNRDVWGYGTSVLFSLEAIRELNFSHWVQTDLSESAYHALVNLAATDTPVSLSSFLDYQCGQNNPLAVLFHSGAPLLKDNNYSFRKEYVISASEITSYWRKCLLEYLRDTAIPLGLLNTDVVKADGKPVQVIQLSSIGRFFTGDSSVSCIIQGRQFEPVVVQDDFFVLFTGPNPPAEMDIARFAQRTGLTEGCLLKITSSSVKKAIGNGIFVSDMLDALYEHSAEDIPETVSSAIEEWAEECRWITAETRVVITCPDERTAAHIVKLTGQKVNRLSSRVFSVPNRNMLKKLLKMLGEHGIFLDGP